MLRRLQALARVIRPRALAHTAKSVAELAASTRELRHALKDVDAMLSELTASSRRLESDVRALTQTLSEVTVRESQLRAVYRRDAELAGDLDALSSILDVPAIAQHARRAIAAAPLCAEPFPHTVVENLWPEPFYEALIKGIPPPELFNDRPVNKQRLVVPFEWGPLYSRRVWDFLVNRVLDDVVAPAVVEKFKAPLSEWLRSNWSLPEEPTTQVRFQSTDGRILLRRRGYVITPHRDPKWGFITCLMYLARAGDSERWGTQLFSVSEDIEAPSVAPHWIPGEQCRLEREIPFRRNTALIFLNSAGAHGARIPEDAEPPDLERYLYQFRIGPTPNAIRELMRLLPEDRRSLWAGKVVDYA